jgi:hypothetical protein
MKTDPLEFFPLHKSDVANARALLALGYPALGPHLMELLEWLQDGNWPISRPIGEFLLTIPEAIAPLIQEVLAGEDHQWKYWCIVRLIGEMKPKVAEQFRSELLRLAEFPTLAEAQNELDKEAQGALQKLWPADWRLDLACFYEKSRTILFCSFDLPTMHEPCFAPPGLIIVPEVTIPNMERAVRELYESGRFFPFLKPIAIADLQSIEVRNWPPLPP